MDLPTLNEPRTVEIRDVDGDGKPDVSVGEFNVGEAVSVFRNLATPGIITNSSFASRVDFPEGAWADGFDLGDLNGDGRPDLRRRRPSTQPMVGLCQPQHPGQFHQQLPGPARGPRVRLQPQ